MYPLINRRTPLKQECNTILCKTLVRPILTSPSPVWYGTNKTNYRLQNKILQISVRNSQIHRHTKTPTIHDFQDRNPLTYARNQDYHRTSIFTQTAVAWLDNIKIEGIPAYAGPIKWFVPLLGGVAQIVI